MKRPQVMKILQRVAANSLQQQVRIDNMQFGFKTGRSITYAIFIERQLQEKFPAIKQDTAHVHGICRTGKGVWSCMHTCHLVGSLQNPVLKSGWCGSCMKMREAECMLVTTKDQVSSQALLERMQLDDLAKVLRTSRLRWRSYVHRPPKVWHHFLQLVNSW